MDVTCKYSTNETYDISKNYDGKTFHKYYAPFHRQITTKVYIQQNIIKQKAELVVIKKVIFYLLLYKSKSFEWQIYLLFFVLNYKKLSLHMA